LAFLKYRTISAESMLEKDVLEELERIHAANSGPLGLLLK
jgi:hypothetical protein